jgi:hypothetical protein
LGTTLVDRVVEGIGRVTLGLHSLPEVVVSIADEGGVNPVLSEEHRSENLGRLLVTGSYVGRDGDLEVTAQVRDPSGQRVLYMSDPIRVSRRPAADEMEPLTLAVMGAVGIHLHIGLDNVSYVPPYPAFHEFLTGVEKGWGTGSLRDGADHIENALRVEPEFLGPALFLAGNHLHFGKREMAAPFLDHIRQRAHRLTEFEGLEFEVCEAWYQGSLGRALHAARRMREIAPWDLSAIALHAKMAYQLNRPGEVADLSYVHEYAPRVFARYRRIAMTYAARSYDRLGRYEELHELARQMRRDAPGNTTAFSTEAIALAGLGRLDELDALIEECRSFPGGECDASWVMLRPSWYLAANGHREKCLEYGNRVASLFESLPEGEFKQRRDDYLLALRTAERWDEYEALARELSESAEYGSNFKSYCLSCVGMAAAHRGDRETAEGLISQFETAGDFYYAAQVSGYLGDLDRAIDYLQRGLEHQEGITYSSLYRWDIDLQPLWGYEPFEEMVRPKG